MIALIGYVASIWLANWALVNFGLIPVGFGLVAPAGVLFAGLSFTLRDIVQDRLGRLWTVAAILAGALVSALISPQLAVASGLAFLVSEASDMAVYSPLRERNWLAAVGLSNTVGLVIDSALFLWLAFGSLDFLAGQILGKLEVTIVTVVVLAFFRRPSWQFAH